jgi:hypothetical protein
MPLVPSCCTGKLYISHNTIFCAQEIAHIPIYLSIVYPYTYDNAYANHAKPRHVTRALTCQSTYSLGKNCSALSFP